MKGLYFRVPDALTHIHRTDECLGSVTQVQSLDTPEGKIVTANHAVNWPSGAILQRDLNWIAGAGWIVTPAGRVGALDEIIGLRLSGGRAAMAQLLRESLGSYQILVLVDGKLEIWSDAFGTHVHFRTRSGELRLAPSPGLLTEAPPDAALIDELRRFGYLLGVETAWRDISLVHPGAVETESGEWTYWRCLSPPLHPEAVIDALRDSLDRLPARPDILPLSGGFDSRVVLSVRTPQLAYTFGPDGCREREIAQQLGARVKNHIAFQLADVPHRPEATERVRELFNGVYAGTFDELVDVYRLVHKHTSAGGWFYDGHLGDVLQRGTYYIPKSIIGRLRWLPRPVEATLARSFEELLMGTMGRTDVPPSLGRCTTEKNALQRAWPLETPAFYTLFQAMYGRGRRYILHGGTVLAHQFFSPVHIWWQDSLPDTFLTAPVDQVITGRTFDRVWSRVDRELMALPHNKGPRPGGNPFANRIRLGAVFGAAKLGIRRFTDYESELHILRAQRRDRRARE